MPEITLCRYCKQSINKDADDYVVMRHAADRFPEELAHAACEQKQPAPFGFEQWMRALRWPCRS
jgi:hypothetical protein